jgi:hypothetical protein
VRKRKRSLKRPRRALPPNTTHRKVASKTAGRINSRAQGGRRTISSPAPAAKVRRKPKSVRAAWTEDAITAAINAVWDQSDGSQMSNCAVTVPRPNQDCNCFVKNAVRGFFSSSQPFDGPDQKADAIIDILTTANGWSEIPDAGDGGTQRSLDAIAAVDAAKIVIAGMKSGDLGDTNGHLAVLVKGSDSAPSSGIAKVPNCTAGSGNASARVKNKGVNWSFGKNNAGKVRYFQQLPDTSPQRRLSRGKHRNHP